eukprot:6450851-Prymnesium_polylepis.1
MHMNEVAEVEQPERKKHRDEAPGASPAAAADAPAGSAAATTPRRGAAGPVVACRDHARPTPCPPAGWSALSA